ncbi:MAG TPA: hypothetical protein VJ998_10255, partial [Pseudomonadales bacterium]|nr:hypothetical protein [Pseudomonadales bacterium]
MTVTHLFRYQALQHRTYQDEGHPRLISPPGADLIAALLVAVISGAVLYLATSEYTRKTTVAGYIEPARGTHRVYARNPGIVSKVLVVPGQLVRRHQVIAVLSRAGGVSAAERERMLADFQHQKDQVARRMDASRAGAIARRQQIEQQRAALRHALSHTTKIMAIQRREVAQRRKTLDDARPLYKSGRLSRLEWNRFTAALLDAQKQLEHFASAASDKRDSLAELDVAIRRAGLENASQQASLQQELSTIDQKRRALIVKSDGSVRITIAGRVANVFV